MLRILSLLLLIICLALMQVEDSKEMVSTYFKRSTFAAQFRS